VRVDRLSAAGLNAALEAVAPRAVLVVGYSPSFHRAAWRAAWRRGHPILFRGETNDGASDRLGPARWIRRAGLGFVYGRADACLWIGQRSRAHFERLGVPPDRLFFSPYCVDESPFAPSDADRERLRPEARHALALDDDDWLVLYAGKLSLRKGVDLIVPAVQAWRQSRSRRVVIGLVGDGALGPDVARAAASHSDLPVRCLGFQNQRQLSRFYHAADLMVLPSRHSETWGLVVNEALHHGLPCVVSDRVGSAPDLIDERTGAVFPSRDAGAFAAALGRAEGLVRRPDVRAACRAKVRPYSVLAAAQGIAAAYNEVIGRQGRRAS
jgi:glycosyltransferase involved in cell wall biosynthesis